MRTTRRLVYGLTIAGFVAAATMFGAGAARAGGGCHSEQVDAAATLVQLSNHCFDPAIVRVEPGTTVEFVNRDGLGHNIVGYAMGWGRYETLPSGGTMTATFDTPGIHPFACTLHPGMVGAVVVGTDAAAFMPGAPESQFPWQNLTLGAAAMLGAVAVWRWSKPKLPPIATPGASQS